MFLYQPDYNSYQYIEGSDPILIKSIPAGSYTARNSPRGIYISPVLFCGDHIVPIESPQVDQLKREIADFFDDTITSRLAENGISHRRGIILYGEPGTGKTSIVRSLVPYIISRNAIVILDPNPYELRSEIIPAIRQCDNNRHIVVIWDDFDRGLRQNSGLLQLLDGTSSPDHLLVVCTTNHINSIPDRLRNRPSRFGLILEIPRLNYVSRLQFVASKYPGISKDVADSLISITANQELDHLHEVCKLHLMGYTISEIVDRIDLAWQQKRDSKDNSNNEDEDEDGDVIDVVVFEDRSSS